MSDVEIHEQRAERGRRIIEQVRELEAADRVRYQAFAATIKSKNKKHVHRRDQAAAMVGAAINAPYSGELLRRSDCPFVVISRISYYAEDDLRALAEFILDSVPLRRGKPDRVRRRKPISATSPGL